MEAGFLTPLSLSVVQDGIDTQYIDWLSDLAVLFFPECFNLLVEELFGLYDAPNNLSTS